MPHSLARPRSPQRLWIGMLLLVLLFRAYIPVGFMPASGVPFLLEVCPAGLPTAMPGHVHHMHHPMGETGNAHDGFDRCPYGSAPASGPLANYLAFTLALKSHYYAEPASGGPLFVVRAPRAHPARGPPSFA